MASKVTFNPLTWVNKVTKRSASNFNRMETGIKDCATSTNALIDELATVNNNLVRKWVDMNGEYCGELYGSSSYHPYAIKSGHLATVTGNFNIYKAITSDTVVFSNLYTASSNRWIPIVSLDSGITYPGYITGESLRIANLPVGNYYIGFNYMAEI